MSYYVSNKHLLLLDNYFPSLVLCGLLRLQNPVQRRGRVWVPASGRYPQDSAEVPGAV
jgi:hypothetical protein